MRAYQPVSTDDALESNTENKKPTYTFSQNEKILLMLSAITLTASAILFREVYLLLFQAKPLLLQTEYGIEDHCTASATGAIQKIFEQCVKPSNATAFFDLGSANGISPLLSDDKTIPVSVRSVASWFDPIAWIHYFTCQNNPLENVIKMTGTTFSGTPKTVFEKAANGFTVITANISTIPNPLFGIGNKTIQPAIEMFLAGYCILLQNGGFSPNRNEHFKGFERFAESFGTYADRFAIIYLCFTIAAAITTATLLCKKALINCHTRLFKTPDENQDHSIQARTEETSAVSPA